MEKDPPMKNYPDLKRLLLEINKQKRKKLWKCEYYAINKIKKLS